MTKKIPIEIQDVQIHPVVPPDLMPDQLGAQTMKLQQLMSSASDAGPAFLAGLALVGVGVYYYVNKKDIDRAQLFSIWAAVAFLLLR